MSKPLVANLTNFADFAPPQLDIVLTVCFKKRRGQGKKKKTPNLVFDSWWALGALFWGFCDSCFWGKFTRYHKSKNTSQNLQPPVPSEALTKEKLKMATNVSKNSPTSVLKDFKSEKSLLEVLGLARYSMASVYQKFVDSGYWDDRYHRGRRPCLARTGSLRFKRFRISSSAEERSRERRLATKFLNHPAIDGWNVVDGAMALLVAWDAFCDELDYEANDLYNVSLHTRMQIAAALSVSWKWQRCSQSCFTRRFHSDEPALASPHTYELAQLAYSFHTEEEQARFGPFDVSNTHAIKQLYDEMVGLEFKLLVEVSTFSALTEAPQEMAECRLNQLFDRGVRTADEVMALRAILPFFAATGANQLVFCSDTPPAPAVAGAALVCAAWLAASVGENPESLFVHSAAILFLFSEEERALAKDFLHTSIHHGSIEAATVKVGVFQSPKWRFAALIARPNLEKALANADRVGKK